MHKYLRAFTGLPLFVGTIMKCLVTGFLISIIFNSSLFAQHQDYISIVTAPIPKVELSEPVLSSQLLCGVNCLYLALKLLHENPSYNDILKSFPGVSNKGTSLEQIKSYLIRKGYACKIQDINDIALKRIEGDVVALVLLQQATSFHIVLKKSQIKPEGLLVIDPPNEKYFVPAKSLSTESHVTLLVSKTPLSGESHSKCFLVYLLGGISAASGCLFLYLKKCKYV